MAVTVYYSSAHEAKSKKFSSTKVLKVPFIANHSLAKAPYFAVRNKTKQKRKGAFMYFISVSPRLAGEYRQWL